MGCGITPWKLTGLGVARYEDVPGCRGRGCAGCTTAALEVGREAEGMASFETGALAVFVGPDCGLTCFASLDSEICAGGTSRSPLAFSFTRQSWQPQGPCRTVSFGRGLDVVLRSDCF